MKTTNTLSVCKTGLAVDVNWQSFIYCEVTKQYGEIVSDKAFKEVPWDREFYFIPGFTKYAINKEGVLKNIATGRNIAWCVDKGGGVKNITGGYHLTNIHSDLGVRKGVTRHRLLAMLFIPCPGKFEDYTVNHKDGKPGNDRLDNLEWMTYSENNQHAYDTGLRPNGTVPVTLRYWRSGEEMKFMSIENCAEFLGKKHSSIDQRIRRNNGVAFSDGLQIKRDDVGEWIDPKVRIGRVRETVECVALEVKTKKQHIFSSANAMSQLLNISPYIIRKAMAAESCEPYNGYLFRYFDQDTVWPID